MKVKKMEDADLILGIARQEEAAFETLVRRWEEPLFRFLSRVTGSPDLAEDARQTTFLQVLRSASTYRGGKASSWIYQIAYRTALNTRRAEKRAGMQGLEDRDEFQAAGPGPLDHAEHTEKKQAVRQALQGVGASDRALLWLRVVEGLSLEETAGILGSPPTTVRYRFLKALGRIRGFLKVSMMNGE